MPCFGCSCAAAASTGYGPHYTRPVAPSGASPTVTEPWQGHTSAITRHSVPRGLGGGGRSTTCRRCRGELLTAGQVHQHAHYTSTVHSRRSRSDRRPASASRPAHLRLARLPERRRRRLSRPRSSPSDAAASNCSTSPSPDADVRSRFKMSRQMVRTWRSVPPRLAACIQLSRPPMRGRPWIGSALRVTPPWRC